MKNPKNPFVQIEERRNSYEGGQDFEFPGGVEFRELRVSFGGRLMVTIKAVFQGDRRIICELSAQNSHMPIDAGLSSEEVADMIHGLFEAKEWHHIRLGDVLASGWKSICQRK